MSSLTQNFERATFDASQFCNDWNHDVESGLSDLKRIFPIGSEINMALHKAYGTFKMMGNDVYCSYLNGLKVLDALEKLAEDDEWKSKFDDLTLDKMNFHAVTKVTIKMKNFDTPNALVPSLTTTLYQDNLDVVERYIINHPNLVESDNTRATHNIPFRDVLEYRRAKIKNNLEATAMKTRETEAHELVVRALTSFVSKKKPLRRV